MRTAATVVGSRLRAGRSRLGIVACLALPLFLPACTRDARETTDSVAGTVAAPAMLSLDEVTGTWNMRTIPEAAGDTITAYVLEAKADTSGWTVAHPGRPAVPVRVWAQGDSVITEVAYESAQRPGVQVTAHTVLRLHGDSLVGTSIVRYSSGPDSVVRRRTVGVRAR